MPYRTIVRRQAYISKISLPFQKSGSVSIEYRHTVQEAVASCFFKKEDFMNVEKIEFVMNKQKNIALIAHDNKKQELIEWCLQN